MTVVFTYQRGPDVGGIGVRTKSENRLVPSELEERLMTLVWNEISSRRLHCQRIGRPERKGTGDALLPQRAGEAVRR